jgi:hypothetical protein
MKVSSLVKATVCAVCILSAAGCASEPPSHEKTRLTTIDKEYGTLRFKGTVTRVDKGTEYEYQVDLSVTFLPDAPFNRVAAVDLTYCDLVASKRREAGGEIDRELEGEHFDSLQRSRQLLTFHLSDANETKRLPPLLFRLRESSVARADYVVLIVGDRHFGWPISVELK